MLKISRSIDSLIQLEEGRVRVDGDSTAKHDRNMFDGSEINNDKFDGNEIGNNEVKKKVKKCLSQKIYLSPKDCLSSKKQ